jgi:glutathione synthase/RimK-type ligase-like ATP-grasp enzyme
MSMGKVLILASRDDPHTTAVKSELYRARAEILEIDIWSSFGSKTLDLRSPFLPEYDGAWLRTKPNVADTVSDFELFAIRERKEFLYGHYGLVATGGWINDPWCQERSKGKVSQLLKAKALNLNIPDTVIGTDLAEIEKLYADGGEVIYKPMTWLATTEGQVLFTNTISLAALRDAHSAIRNVPGIFQKRIVKSCEYRITIVDEEVFAVRIFSQDDPEAALDWRRKQMSLRYEVCKPQEFNCDLLQALLRELGLRFGAFDIIETTNGEMVFLEVNPAGNWLWLEDKLDLRISSAIASALLSKGKRLGGHQKR